ncbi:DMT family transporter [Bacillus sp. B1-b2]|uniref:DMT family transporter n=1 Tax=Bacillus sp. B1-b2 TaxID=2653201 RepID=UPI001262A831|nr:DMT family transporter [Bacillus sp. B1-b2]KAB7668879.1 DMT family transporter [Bacillus sp. B1-b2]
MITGLIVAFISGSLVGIQNIFNNRVNQKAGLWATTTLVLALGFVASFILGVITEGTALFHLENMHTGYWFSGIIGVGVVVCMTTGIKALGATYAVSISLSAQLIFALLFDSIGLLGLEKVPFSPKQLIGVVVIIGGILVFKMGGKQEQAQPIKELARK